MPPTQQRTDEPTTNQPPPAQQDNDLTSPSRLRDDQGISTNPQAEYVAAGGFALNSMLRAMPFYIDDLTRDFGDDLYERMLNDPQVDSCVEILKLAVLSQGMHLVSAVKEQDPRSALAKEIRDFCQRNIERLRTPFVAATLYDMLDALAFGNKVAELTYEICEYGIDEGKMCLKSVKVKPRRSVAFIVDPYLNIVGLVGQKVGQSAPVVGITSSNPSQIANILPRQKFAVLTYRPRNNDPRGTSVIRPAYTPWWMKQQSLPEWLKYMSQFAGPSLKGKLAPNAQKVPMLNADGTTAKDENGNTIWIDPAAAFLRSLERFRNGTAIVYPDGAEVDVVQANSQAGSPFDAALSSFDRQIAKAILCQTLATEEGRFQARAAAQTHQDVLELVIYHAKISLSSMIYHDILRTLVEYNYGKEAAYYLTPIPSLSETERHDFAQNASAIARLMNTGYLHPSQYSEVDSMLSLPPRSDPEEDGLAIRDKRRAELQIQVADESESENQQGRGDHPTQGGIGEGGDGGSPDDIDQRMNEGQPE